MTQLILGGGFGAVLGALAVGVLLFLERGKRAVAEQELVQVPRLRKQLAEQGALVAKLGKMVVMKEKQIRDLEEKLAAHLDESDLAAELDRVFDSIGDGGNRGGKPGSSSGTGSAN